MTNETFTTPPPRAGDFRDLCTLEHSAGAYVSTCGEANIGGNVFGGQLMAQALAAAAADVDPSRSLRRLHASFLRPVQLHPFARYRVQCSMEGRTFSQREIQVGEPDVPQFLASLSFQQPTAGPEHAAIAPEVARAETLSDLPSLAAQYSERLSEGHRRILGHQQLYDLRPLDGEDFLFCSQRRTQLRYWIRSNTDLGEDVRLHEAALLFMSDAWFNSPVLMPHVPARLSRTFMAPTLSHDLWLHRPFRADDWLLFDITSPSLRGEVGLSTANIFSANGDLVASATQQSLLRLL